VHTGESYTSYLSGLDKTIIVPSQGGENHLKLADRHIYMAGGMMDFCFKRALKDVLEMNAHSSEPLYVHLVEPAIYNKRFNNKRPEEIQEKFKEFINDVTDSGKTLQGYESLVTIDVILNTTPLE
ncbi:MAG TPA: hypothetical protein VN132_10140, partial [Bdellovibrio sp.]|nr:hypothetical protein [Bdellovibrio sp.]